LVGACLLQLPQQSRQHVVATMSIQLKLIVHKRGRQHGAVDVLAAACAHQRGVRPSGAAICMPVAKSRDRRWWALALHSLRLPSGPERLYDDVVPAGA
jgi:hypothetical protein